MPKQDHWNYYCGITTDLTRMRKKLLDIRNIYDGDWSRHGSYSPNLDSLCKDFTLCLFPLKDLVDAALKVAEELQRRHRAEEEISNETLLDIPEATPLRALRDATDADCDKTRWQDAVHSAAGGNPKISDALRSAMSLADEVRYAATRVAHRSKQKRMCGADDDEILEALVRSDDWRFLCDIGVNMKEWRRLQELNNILPTARPETSPE